MVCTSPSPGCSDSTTIDSGTMNTSPPAATDMPSMIASVSGSRIDTVVPWPARLRISTWPPSVVMFFFTTSMPTPRPDRSVSVSAVEKPGANTRSQTWASLGSSGTASPRSAALRRMRSRSRPRPSSPISMTMLAPWCAALRLIVPASGLPAAARSAGVSRPWSIALRTRCTSGSTIFSITPLSSSVASPEVRSCTCLPRRVARSRTMRGKRLKANSTGSMRTPSTDSCRSRVLRSSCTRPANSGSLATGSRCSQRWRSMAWVITSSPTRLIRASTLATATRIELSTPSPTLPTNASAVGVAASASGAAPAAAAGIAVAAGAASWRMSSAHSSSTQANASSIAARGTLPGSVSCQPR